jgi:peptidoglycan L-alanyl-D-glutamate endopeptidase CwlK
MVLPAFDGALGTSSLRDGDTGPAVAQLQQALRQHRFNPGAIDGRFGPATRAAVIGFQLSEQLLADGVAGPRTMARLGLAASDALPSVVPGVTVEIVSRLFPFTPVDNIRTNLPFVLTGLVERSLGDRPMVLMALATIRAETEGFEPISEGRSKFNTSPGGHAFDLYDFRKDLGNQGPPDGERFRGRGFVQLTGRHNYGQYGANIGLGTRLVDDPDLANDAAIAGRLLADFLHVHERAIKEALVDGNLRLARRLVNGGSNGLDRFMDTYEQGERLIGGSVNS